MLDAEQMKRHKNGTWCPECRMVDAAWWSGDVFFICSVYYITVRKWFFVLCAECVSFLDDELGQKTVVLTGQRMRNTSTCVHKRARESSVSSLSNSDLAALLFRLLKQYSVCIFPILSAHFSDGTYYLMTSYIDVLTPHSSHL